MNISTCTIFIIIIYQKSSTISFSKIIGVIKRNWRPYCGMLSPNGNVKVTK